MKDNSNSPVCEILCAISLGCWILANLILIVSGDFFDLLIDITGIFTEESGIPKVKLPERLSSPI